MGLLKNEYGVFHVRRKVPKALEVATARVMGVSKERVSWLKETLATKDERQAKVLAPPVMMKFDRILAQAEALLVAHPVRTELSEAEIKQIADYFYAHQLVADEELREGGRARQTADRLAEAGVEPSVGSVGDSYDNALAETINGLYKAELIHRRGPWRNFEAVEFATLEWVDWFNNRRLLEPIGNIPPAEAEQRYYAMLEQPAMAA